MNNNKNLMDMIKGTWLRAIISFVPFLLLIFVFSCDDEIETIPFYEGIYEGRSESITEYVVAREDTFSMFKQLLEVGSVYWTLTAYNPHGNDYTLFLPTNNAFENFIAHDERYDSFQDLLDDSEYVRILVRYHIVNRAIQRNDFPYGALPDTTLSGDLLTISFTGDIGATVLKVNNEASIIQHDIELTNGYIHVIDEVLKPIVFSSFEWISNAPHYSIFAQALIETGLKDTFKIESVGRDPKYPSNTLLIESDEVFARKGIFSISDLKNEYSYGSQDYQNFDNGLYQFIAYHILEGKNFLNNFEGVTSNYNTYASLPVWINGAGLELKINTGVEVFDSIFSDTDTTLIDYVGINYDISNISTKNGAIHILDNVLEQFRPSPTQRIFQFLEEPSLANAKITPGNYRFDLDDLGNFEVIKWQGVEVIDYINSASALPDVYGNDYLEIEGSFSITYEIPKILPGRYIILIRANDDYFNNATIQVSLDGKSIGGNIDLASNPNKNTSFYNFEVGRVVFDNYEKHLLRIQTLIPGRFSWDAVIFNPF